MHGRRRWGTILLVVSLALVVFLLAQAWVHRAEVVSAVAGTPIAALLGAAALILAGYTLRLGKWLWLLHRLGLGTRRAESALLFAAGLLLILTPAKLGELWKAFALAERRGLPTATVLPAVVMERVVDMSAVALLTVAATMVLGTSGFAVWAIAAVTALGLWLLTRPWVWVRIARWSERNPKLGDAARGLGTGLTSLGRPTTLLVALAIGLTAWTLEGAAIKILLDGLGFPVSWTFGLWVFCAGTMAGVLSALPGGLGSAEAVMVLLLTQAGAPAGVAGAATLLVRVGVLGLGGLIGAIALPTWLAVKRVPIAATPPAPPAAGESPLSPDR